MSTSSLPNPKKTPTFLNQTKALCTILYIQRQRNKGQAILELFWPLLYMLILTLISLLIPKLPPDTDLPLFPFPPLTEICDTAVKELDHVVVTNSTLTKDSIPCFDIICIPCTSAPYTSLLFQVYNNSLLLLKRPLNIATFSSEKEYFDYYYDPKKSNFTGDYYLTPTFPRDIHHIFGTVIHIPNPNLQEISLFEPYLGDIFALGTSPIADVAIHLARNPAVKKPLKSSAFHTGILSWQSFLQNSIMGYKTNISLGASFSMQDSPVSDSLLLQPPGASTFTLFPFYMTFVYLFSLLFLVIGLVTQKEEGTRQLLLVMGLNRNVYWLSYILFSLFSALFAIVIILSIGSALSLFKYSNGFLVIVVFFLAAIAQIVVGLVISIMFDKVKTAASVVSLFVNLGAFGFVLVSRFYRLQNGFLNFIFSLIYLIPFGQMVHNISVLEYSNIGLTFDTMSMSDPILMPISTNDLFLWFLFDIIFYSFLVWYLEHVLEQPRYPPLFFLSKSYWLPVPSQHEDVEHVEDGTDAADGSEDAAEPEPEDPEETTSNALQLQSLDDDANPHTPKPTNKTTIALYSLCKEYTRKTKGKSKKKFKANDNISFSVQKGEIFVYLGKNGSGKSTTLKMISGLETPTSGDGIIAGYSMKENMDQIRQNLGVVPQENVFFKQISAMEHMQLFARIKGIDPTQIDNLCLELLSMVGLKGRGDEFVENFSGGMQRKLQFAISIVGRPKVLLLDELAAGMDISSEQAIWYLTQEIARVWDTSIILTTHNMAEAEYLAHRIGIILNGRLGVIGSPIQLKNHFGSGYIITIQYHSPQIVDALKPILVSHLPTIRFDGPALKSSVEFVGGNGVVFEDSSNTDSLTFSVPFQSRTQFPQFFQFLEDSSESLHIDSWTITTSSLEEIFITLVNQGSSNSNSNGEDKLLDFS